MKLFCVFVVCKIHQWKYEIDGAFSGDGDKGLHKQRIQARTRQFHLSVQGLFESLLLRIGKFEQDIQILNNVNIIIRMFRRHHHFKEYNSMKYTNIHNLEGLWN